ncbi:trithorax group protein osa-like isoform X4 [Physella acuta]|uniref:trithorax group protein osa-like isoform X4 n=1 Tax=Physella acuta TaxID=109671 RepID=UPI0027DC7BBF|nr:trithorax group protein osa-like isoform X4 [Physella acuta]
MNNGTYCYPGGGGHARSRFTGDPEQFDKMEEGSVNNVNTHQMTGPGYGGSATGSGFRSQFQTQIQGSEFGGNSPDDDACGTTSRPTTGYINPDYPVNSQYQGHAHPYAQHARYFPGSAPNKIQQSMHPIYSMTSNSIGSITPNQPSNYSPHRMHSVPGHGFPVQQTGTTPTLNNLLQSSSTITKATPSLSISSSSSRDDNLAPSLQSKSEMNSPPQTPYSLHHQQQQPPGWGSRLGGHPYTYPQQAPGSTLYRSQSGGNNDMSQGRRPTMGGSYPPQGGQYMSQQMAMGPGPQRFMMGGQMPNQMYGHGPPQPQMYMPPSQQPPGPPLSPAARPPTPQQSQIQQMQNMVQNSPKQPSPSPSDHGSVYSMKQEENSQDMKSDLGLSEDLSGDNSRGSTGGPRPAPSPVGSSGSRSNTPASIPGVQAGSPMPVRPPSGQVDGHNRMTQSPMATQGMDTGYNQQMMPPPNTMGYMPSSGKMGSGPMPGHFPQYNAQYPQGNYGRQQPGMGGPPMSGPMQNYPVPQPNMYPNGPGQMPGAPMYGNMPGMNRSMGQQGYGPGAYPQSNTNMGPMMNSQYPGYSMGPMPGQHGMPQPSGPGSMPPGSTSGPMAPNLSGQAGMMPQQHTSSSNKAAQAAQAAMMAAANTVGPRMSHSRGSMSPSRGMFGQSGGPLAQMNNMTNSPNLGSPSLNSMSNAVEQLARSSSGGMNSSIVGGPSISSPVPKSAHSPAAMTNNSSSIAHGGDQNQTSPLSNADTHDSSSRPNSTTAHHPDLPNNESTTGSDSSGGVPSDSTSVDSGFHSSDQGEKTSDSVSTPSGASPLPSGSHHNGDNSRTLENISPPGHNTSDHLHHPHMQHPHHLMGSESKMPYNDSGIPLPPSSMSSAMSSMPSSSSSVVTTANTGPMLTSVTQSIASPVTSVSTSIPYHPHAHPHHMGPHGGHPHLMGHGMGPHGMMPNGMPPNSMMNAGHMGGPNQMPPNMGGPHMMPPNMGGPNMNMNQNGPMMGPNGPLMTHNGPLMPGHPGINAGGNNPNMPMGQMPQHQPQMNCMPPMNNNNINAGTNTPSDDPPEKKKKVKKSSSDLSKLFEMGPEPDRRLFLERVLSYLEESGQPVTALPVISKTPLDLYKLYFCVRDKGGFEEVTRGKKWRDICTVVNIGTSASAAFTLKKNYIRYLFNYECKFDRGGINPAPILAQMEAQLAHKREQKSKRAPSPAGSNSNDAFRPPSVPNNQMDSYPPNMPPPYMQNPDGSMPNPHMSGPNMMMGPNNMMGASGTHSGMGNMMGGPPMGSSGMMGGPMPNMMQGQPGMMPTNSNSGNMMSGPPMMPGAPPGYGGPMLQQPPGGPIPPTSSSAPPMPPHSSVSGPMPVTSDSVSVQDPFSDESSYLQQRGMPPQLTPPPQAMSVASSTPMSSSFPGNVTVSNNTSRPISSSGYGVPEQQMSGYPPNANQPSMPPTSSGGQFPFGQADRFDQSSPNLAMRPPGPTPGMAPSQQPPQQPGESSSPMYPGTRFPGPTQPLGIRPPQAGDAPGQYPPPGPPYHGQSGYPGPQYPNYPTGPYPGPRPPGPGTMYGTPSKRFPDDSVPNQYSDWSNPNMGNHMSYASGPSERQAPSPDERARDVNQWSPMQRSRMPQGGPNYMPPPSPSTPPMGPFVRQLGHRNSPQNREPPPRFGVPQKMPPAYVGMATTTMTKKELIFPSDCVEGIGIATTKRKKLTHKDLAPFEAWRLMLALKSGLLAESTWALDTLNILLYDDATYGYFSLNTLPGLLEVLTEHFRHCLMQMFDEFQDLEEGQSRRHRYHNYKLKVKPLSSSQEETCEQQVENQGEDEDKKDDPKQFRLSGPNYTMISRKGLPVKVDPNPADTTVVETKDWDLYTNFNTEPDHWLSGRGDITHHILTHLESDNSNTFLSGKFRRKRNRCSEEEEEKCSDSFCLGQKGVKSCKREQCDAIEVNFRESNNNNDRIGLCQSDTKSEEQHKAMLSNLSPVNNVAVSNDSPTLEPKNPVTDNSISEAYHSKLCNGESISEGNKTGVTPLEIKQEPVENSDKSDSHTDLSNSDTKSKEVKESTANDLDGENNSLKPYTEEDETKKVESCKADKENTKCKPVENGELEEPKLSPMVNHLDKTNSPPAADKNHSGADSSNKSEEKEADTCSNSSPPVLKAECFDGEEDMAVDATAEPMNSTMNTSGSGVSMEADTSAVMETSLTGDGKEIKEEKKMEGKPTEKQETEQLDESCFKKALMGCENTVFNESYVSETEELSASIVADMLKEDEHMEDEAFQRDDPPLCVTPESRDELGRRCVCISNIIRSLSCVPGNEARICKHPGIMRVLGRLLLLHHSHPERPPPRKLPSGDEEEEEREEPPRVYDDEHWWWDYLDQLRENTLVILANICGHLMLGNFSEQVCFPLLEGLLHWVICPASVARDPLPTLTPGSVLSPQRLVLEALCKLCIHETNVDLLLATPPVKRLIELFNVLVRLLADRNHQITREFSIVLLSLLVPGESSAARAVALQHPCVSLLVDFLETAEQNALAIANQQGLEVLQSNPEVMGTSLDMLRRAASILLHMARVPDNRKMFVQQQSRLLNLVMSQILDQSVSNTLSEVLFECSQFS